MVPSSATADQPFRSRPEVACSGSSPRVWEFDVVRTTGCARWPTARESTSGSTRWAHLSWMTKTIQDNPNASPTRQTIQSKRTYLCDASFVAVVVPGPRSTVEAISAAAAEPVFAPFLGRRTCVLSTSLLLAAEVTAADPIALFSRIERGPKELLEQLAPIPGAGPGRATRVCRLRSRLPPRTRTSTSTSRTIPARSDASRSAMNFAGPLPRQWRERLAVDVRARLAPSTN